MKTFEKRLKNRFDVNVAFPVTAQTAPVRGTVETELEQLKAGLLRTRLLYTEDTGLYPPLRRAANEAAALAWLTPYPLLVLPLLFEEKAANEEVQWKRQVRIRRETQRLTTRAA